MFVYKLDVSDGDTLWSVTTELGSLVRAQFSPLQVNTHSFFFLICDVIFFVIFILVSK